MSVDSVLYRHWQARAEEAEAEVERLRAERDRWAPIVNTASGLDFHPVCMACVREIAKSPCTTPTPDPTSPCGALVATGGNAHVAEWQDCGRPADGIHHMPAHDYRATRCTCGHAIEEATSA